MKLRAEAAGIEPLERGAAAGPLRAAQGGSPGPLRAAQGGSRPPGGRVAGGGGGGAGAPPRPPPALPARAAARADLLVKTVGRAPALLEAAAPGACLSLLGPLGTAFPAPAP